MAGPATATDHLDRIATDLAAITTHLPVARHHHRDPPTTRTATDTPTTATTPGSRPPAGAFTPGPHVHSRRALEHALAAARFLQLACDELARIDDPDLHRPDPRRCTTCNRELHVLDTHTKCPACRSADNRKRNRP